MQENQKQELILHFKKFYNAMSSVTKQRLKAIAEKELSIAPGTNKEQSFQYCHCERNEVERNNL